MEPQERREKQMSSRLKIEQVDCKEDGLVTLARVQLSLAGEPRTGIASAGTTDSAWQHVIAEATIDSVRGFLENRASVALDAVMEVTSGRFPIVVVTMTLDSGGREEFLSGTAVLMDDRQTAVTKAVLHGLNRRLEELLS